MIEQLGFFFQERPAPPVADDEVDLGSCRLPVHYQKNTRAKHYLIYVRRNGTIRVTVPKYGTRLEASQFVQEKQSWIRRQWEKVNAPGWLPRSWAPGTKIWFNGDEVTLELDQSNGQNQISVGPLLFPAKANQPDLRPIVEEQLRRYASRVLPPRTMELAEIHGLSPESITVRNQSSRWGSCSEAGRISLNWRLVQTPEKVRDYVIIHELMHLKELNHSKKFWSLVENACP
ncbi:MAG: SprT family zinc-dependent metalloprotease, partial [Verrucomicrobiota bacterium]